MARVPGNTWSSPCFPRSRDPTEGSPDRLANQEPFALQLSLYESLTNNQVSGSSSSFDSTIKPRVIFVRIATGFLEAECMV